MTRFHDLMRFAKTGIAHPDMTGYDKLKALALFPQSYPSQTITGIPPLSFKANGQPLASWSISGNTVQTGTPTPDAPIYPEFVGERTENLFDISTAEDTEYYINYAGYLVIGADGDRFIAQKVSVTPLTAYTFSWGDTTVGTDGNSPYIRVCEYANTQFLSRVAYKCIDYVNKTFKIITSQDTTVLDIRYDSNTSTRKQTITNLMLNTGSTAKPYEPYGYKLPITCGSQTTPVYLGQTQTVREIRKVVFDGTEQGWGKNTGLTNSNAFSISMPNWVGNRKIGYCTHYQNVADAQAAEGVFFGNSLNILTALADGLDDATKFKQWLASQYSAGNPVTVWYVLAEPTTGIVNEPLAKIGDYADTVSSTNTGAPSIPTSKGQNTLTVDTTVQPSSVTITT